MLLMGGMPALARDITVRGTVTETSGEPLIGATVAVKDKPGQGTATDIDGNFTINVADNATLVFSYVGFVTKELKAAPKMEVTLQSDQTNLDELVVIGYGAVKRKDLTTAVSTLSLIPITEPTRHIRLTYAG